MVSDSAHQKKNSFYLGEKLNETGQKVFLYREVWGGLNIPTLSKTPAMVVTCIGNKTKYK